MKQITITVPDNCELKQDGNTYTIVEKEKLTYEDVIKGLYLYSRDRVIVEYFNSEKHIQKLRSINKLINVAKYLNNGWQPDWDNNFEKKWYINFNHDTSKKIELTYEARHQNCTVYFKSEELAKQAIKILGEETIKLALCTDY